MGGLFDGILGGVGGGVGLGVGFPVIVIGASHYATREIFATVVGNRRRVHERTLEP